MRTLILALMMMVGIWACHAPTLRAQARPPIIDMHLHADRAGAVPDEGAEARHPL